MSNYVSIEVKRMASLEEISELMQRGRAKNVKVMAQELLDEGYDAQTILDKGLLVAMGIIGVKFKKNEIFVPEVLIAARAMNRGLEVLQPYLINNDVEPIGTAIIGTVKGDLHDIGKNLCTIMLKGKGINVIDLGSDVSASSYVDAAIENNAKIIGCSALLTTTMKEMVNVVKEIDDRGIRDKVTIMVGGAPLSQDYCDSIGADIYTPDAASMADKAYEILKEGN